VRFADAPTERIVAEADLRLRLVAILQLADDLRQAMFAVVAVVPAGLAVILLHGTAVYVILPANAVQLRQAVVRDLLSRAFKRVTGSIPAPLLLSGQRAVLNKQTPSAVVLPAVQAERVIVPLFPHQVLTVVVIPAAGPAARRRHLALQVKTSRRCGRPRRSYSLRGSAATGGFTQGRVIRREYTDSLLKTRVSKARKKQARCVQKEKRIVLKMAT